MRTDKVTIRRVMIYDHSGTYALSLSLSSRLSSPRACLRATSLASCSTGIGDSDNVQARANVSSTEKAPSIQTRL